MVELELIQDSRVRAQASWLELSQEALKHNLLLVKQLTLPGAAVLAVVKANSYGHGLREIGQCLHDEVAYFGVSTVEEALALRRNGISTPILLFGVPFREAVETALESDVSLAVSSVEQACEIARTAERLAKPAVIHVKVDTGMGRLGIPAREAIRSVEKIASLEELRLEGIFTHFPQGEGEQDAFTQNQIRTFREVIEGASRKGIHFAYRHAANTVGIVNYREAHFNLVRPGILLYGVRPSRSFKGHLELKPVLSWKAKLILLKRLQAGESTGYGRTFVADRETVIGILPVGYSHGYSFALSGKSEVLFSGKRYRVAGRVSMDYIAVDFGTGFEGKAGDTVTLLGREGNEEITVETLAELSGTIPYEVITRLSGTIPRMLI